VKKEKCSEETKGHEFNLWCWCFVPPGVIEISATAFLLNGSAEWEAGNVLFFR
jgi:hypothetical protein